MGEIRIVGSGKTRGYLYPVCKIRADDQSHILAIYGWCLIQLVSRRLIYAITGECISKDERASLLSGI